MNKPEPTPSNQPIDDIKPKDPQNVVDLNQSSATSAPLNSTPVEPTPSSPLPPPPPPSPPVEQQPSVAAVQTAIVQVSQLVPETPSKPVEIETTGNVISGKAKLARLLGKNGYNPDSMPDKDTIDQSSYGKPKSWTQHADATAQSTTNNAPTVETSSMYVTTPASSASTGPISSEAKDQEVMSVVSADASSSASESSVNQTEKTVTTQVDTTNVQIEALKSELASQTKWEAVRLQEAVRAQMLEDKKDHAKQLATIEQGHTVELDKMRESAHANLLVALEEQKSTMTKEFEAVVTTRVDEMLKEKEEDLRREIKVEFTEGEMNLSTERQESLQSSQAKVGALSSRFGEVVEHGVRMKDAAKRISNAYVYNQVIIQGQKLTQLEDEGLAQLVTAEQSPNPVSSLEELRSDLKSVAKHGMAAAVVPSAKVGSVWAHALATVFSALKVPVDFRADGRKEPKSDEERIRLAQWAVDEGDLQTAVKALEETSGLARDVVSDWLKQAKHRLIALQAADVLMADAIIAQVSLMK